MADTPVSAVGLVGLLCTTTCDAGWEPAAAVVLLLLLWRRASQCCQVCRTAVLGWIAVLLRADPARCLLHRL